jgi:hypothetical protein
LRAGAVFGVGVRAQQDLSDTGEAGLKIDPVRLEWPRVAESVARGGLVSIPLTGISQQGSKPLERVEVLRVDADDQHPMDGDIENDVLG